jgi:hypothetical protein
MRSQSGSSLSTFIFLVPLLGVPLMAIFGVPQFVPVIASSASDAAARPETTRRSRGVGESAAATERAARVVESREDEQFEDLFRPARSITRDSRPLQGEPVGREIKYVETSRGTDIWLTQTSAEEQAADLFSDRLPHPASSDRNGVSTPMRSSKSMLTSQSQQTGESSNRRITTSPMEQSVQGLTWREAVRQLNELGIQEFRLEPGRQLGEFYFACEFSPDRDARITRRFEAEAKEPLLAVAAVLRQINEWMPKR